MKVSLNDARTVTRFGGFHRRFGIGVLAISLVILGACSGPGVWEEHIASREAAVASIDPEQWGGYVVDCTETRIGDETQGNSEGSEVIACWEWDRANPEDVLWDSVTAISELFLGHNGPLVLRDRCDLGTNPMHAAIPGVCSGVVLDPQNPGSYFSIWVDHDVQDTDWFRQVFDEWKANGYVTTTLLEGRPKVPATVLIAYVDPRLLDE